MTSGSAVAPRSTLPAADPEVADGSKSAGPGPDGARPRRARNEPRSYDFRRPNRLSRDHVRTLQIAYETFGRQFGTILTSTLRVMCQVGLVSVQQLSYDEYVGSLPSPTFMAITSVQPLPGTGMLQLQQETAMVCVDRLLGGPGKQNQPQRAFTDIEKGLLQNIAQRLVHELRYAFESLARLEPSVVGLESSPQFAQIAAPSDVVIVASFEVQVADADGVATLCLPFSALFPALESAANARQANRRGAAAHASAMLSERLNDVTVQVGLQFPPISLTPKEILGLTPGDIVPLRHATSAPLCLTASETTFAYAVPGANGRKLACLVTNDPDTSQHQKGVTR